MFNVGFLPYIMHQGFFNAVLGAEFWPQSQWKKGLYEGCPESSRTQYILERIRPIVGNWSYLCT